MSTIIETCVGRVHVFPQSDGGSKTGMYQMTPNIPEAAGAKCLIMGINLGLTEITQPTVTLDDKRTIYVFGSSWTNTTISGLLLLGESGSSSSSQLDALLAWYKTHRVSKYLAPIDLSMGNSKLAAFVVGLNLMEADSKTNTQGFQITALTSTDA
jgi:hypothetical protein